MFCNFGWITQLLLMSDSFLNKCRNINLYSLIIKSYPMKKITLSLALTLLVLGVSAQVNVSDIATLRSQPADNTTIYNLTNEVILTYQQSFRNQKIIQDGTAAILIDDWSGNITTPYGIGDGITGISGRLEFYASGGYLEFHPILNTGPASSTGNMITPQVLTVDEFMNNFDDYRFELIQLNAMTFDDAGASFVNGTLYDLQDIHRNMAAFYTNFYNVDYIGTVIPSVPQDIIGIAGVRDAGNTKYIAARDSSDFSDSTLYPVPLSSTGILIAVVLIATVALIRFKRFIF